MRRGKVTRLAWKMRRSFCNAFAGPLSNDKQITHFMATAKQLQRVLRFTYGIVPIVAGLDKFTNLLCNWSDYLGSNKSMVPMEPMTFMKVVGVIEIIAG